LNYLVSEHTYLEWKSGDQEQFWARLRSALLKAKKA
jgi:hypothetical protein